MYKEPGIRMASDQEITEHYHQNAGGKITAHLEFYTQIN